MNNKRILVADDSLTVLKALEIKLRAAGYDTSTATDGSDALEKAKAVHPDLVIMDINFPPDISQGGVTWDGFKIIEWMRYTGAAGQAPAIIITSDDVEMHRNQAIAAGAVAVFQKPVSMPDLLETIEECLGVASRAQSLGSSDAWNGIAWAGVGAASNLPLKQPQPLRHSFADAVPRESRNSPSRQKAEGA